jgi:hypothetical protein
MSEDARICAHIRLRDVQDSWLAMPVRSNLNSFGEIGGEAEAAGRRVRRRCEAALTRFSHLSHTMSTAKMSISRRESGSLVNHHYSK